MKLIGPFKQIIPLTNLPVKGPLADESLQVVENGGILVQDGKIKSIGAWKDLRETQVEELEELDQPAVALPGFIDSHTHICFGGKRQQDYALRIAGKSYLEIAAAGGGIWDTVQQTRKATPLQLQEGLSGRLAKQIQQGITTCEVKSGYGLTVEEELKMLKVIQLVGRETAIDLIPTCLAAHTKPRDFPGTNQEYLHLILSELLPIVKSQQLAKRIDIFTEQGAFTVEESRAYLKAAQSMGFELTIHGDQFHTGGSQLGVELGAKSVDHLEASTEKEIESLSKSDVVGTALPGASLGLGCSFTPARKLLDKGGCLAIASDWNPGSAPMGDLLTQAAILGTMEKLSSAETFAAMTVRASMALGLNNQGSLAPNNLADFQAYPTDDFRDILYYQGQMKPLKVWKKGHLIHG